MWRIIIISNLFNYSLLKSLFIKAANKIIYKALRDFMFPIKYFKNYHLPFLYKFNYVLFIITIVFPFFYKMLKSKKNNKGNIKLATRYNILIVINIIPLKPNIGHLHIYGCRVYPFKYNILYLNKLALRAYIRYFIEYNSTNIF